MNAGSEPRGADAEDVPVRAESDHAVPDRAASGRGSSGAERRGIRFGLGVALAIVFGLFFAFDAWEAIGNVVGVSQFANDLGVGLSALGWLALIASVLLPVVLFATAFLLGRRRSLLLQAAFYLVALAVSAVLYLDILALAGPGAVNFFAIPAE